MSGAGVGSVSYVEAMERASVFVFGAWAGAASSSEPQALSPTKRSPKESRRGRRVRMGLIG
jgi:hypothetical protein